MIIKFNSERFEKDYLLSLLSEYGMIDYDLEEGWAEFPDDDSSREILPELEDILR